VDSNSGAKRSGTMKIAGKTFTVTQSAPAPLSVTMYNGNYTGTFNYTYERNNNGTYTEVPGSFQLTVTLSYVRDNGTSIVCNVTHASCTDPAFGCVGGCTPYPWNDTGHQGSEFDLPVNPPNNSSDITSAFWVSLPNTSLGTGGIASTYLTGGLLVTGANGSWTLSNGPIGQYESGWTTFNETPEPWALMPTISDPLWDGSVSYTSWSLVKQ
jgi:hypothetical protein